MKKIIVNKKYNNKMIIPFILDNFKNLNLNTLYKALRKKDIKVNGKGISENILVFENDEIEIYIADKILNPNILEIESIYEDNNIIIINKPEGIEVLGNNSLTSILQQKYNNNEFPYPCHRLDYNTKGLILFAKNRETLNILFDKFKNKEIEKHYLALVYDIPKQNECILEDYLFKDKKKSLVYISKDFKKGYQKIITSYKIIKINKEQNTSILDVTLHTGRTHQIRAHLAFEGFPIIGDRKIW